MKAFTYSIREISTGRWYYGVRYAEGCSPSDMFTTYFTSSSVLDPLIRNSPHKFSYKIKRKFSCKIEAQEWECKILKRTGAAKHPNSFNKHSSGAPPIMFGADNPSTRPEVKAKLREAALRRSPLSEDVLHRMSNTKLKTSIISAFRNDNFKISRSVSLISRYNTYINFIRLNKPRCKYILAYLHMLVHKCETYVTKSYPKNRKSKPRGKMKSISDSKLGAKWFTSPDLLVSKPFHDLNTVPVDWIPGNKVSLRNSKIGDATRKRFTSISN
jgi:hypothetical protein